MKADLLEEKEKDKGKMVESQVRPIISEIKPIRTNSYNQSQPQNTQNIVQNPAQSK